jgi:hypothetical protein
MRRFADWFIWIPAIALILLFLFGLLYSLIVGEPGTSIDSPDWREP